MQLKTHNFGGCFRDNNRFSDITSGTQLVDQGLSLMFRDSWSLWSLVVAWSLKCNMWSLDFHELAIFFFFIVKNQYLINTQFLYQQNAHFIL